MEKPRSYYVFNIILGFVLCMLNFSISIQSFELPITVIIGSLLIFSACFRTKDYYKAPLLMTGAIGLFLLSIISGFSRYLVDYKIFFDEAMTIDQLNNIQIVLQNVYSTIIFSSGFVMIANLIFTLFLILGISSYVSSLFIGINHYNTPYDERKMKRTGYIISILQLAMIVILVGLISGFVSEFISTSFADIDTFDTWIVNIFLQNVWWIAALFFIAVAFVIFAVRYVIFLSKAYSSLKTLESEGKFSK